MESDSENQEKRPSSRGRIDENLIAGYTSGTLTRPERLKVERAMKTDASLRETIALVKAICPNGGCMLPLEEIERLDFKAIKRSAHRGFESPG